MGNNQTSGVSKSCLANFTVPLQNQDPDLIPYAYIGSALKQCSTSSFGYLTNAASKVGLVPNKSISNLVPQINIPPPQNTTQMVQNPSMREMFLGVTQSNDKSSICIAWTTIFWIIVIILAIVIIYKPEYLGIQNHV